MTTYACLECGGPFTPKRASRAFCGPSCRQAFNNRRIQRGGELYDLVMEMRFDRSKAEQRKTWSLLCTLAGRFREEDNATRGGRKSWSSSERLRNVQSRVGR